jgi:hypothetical protein
VPAIAGAAIHRAALQLSGNYRNVRGGATRQHCRDTHENVSGLGSRKIHISIPSMV